MRADTAATVDDHRAVSPNVIVTDELFNSIVESEREFCETIRKIDPRTVVADLVASGPGAFWLVEPFLKRFHSPKILEVGSGNGFGLCDLLLRGLDVVGIEPGSTYPFESRHDRALELLRINGVPSPETVLHRADGEALPFPDESFDIVFSVAVLEHVRDVGECLREAFRILRPGGVLIMNLANYNSFWEGHYYCLWLPYVLSSKKVAKRYVTHVIRRSDRYVDELTFTSPAMLRRVMRQVPSAAGLTIYPFCLKPFTRIAGAVYYLAVDFAEKHRPLLFIRRLGLTKLFLGIGRPLVALLSGLGMAPTFNICVVKRPRA